MPFQFLDLDLALLILAAPFIGSFLAVVAIRFPNVSSVILGRSRCPQCGHRLTGRDLVPILSWTLQRRRCRYCAAPIEIFYPMMEIGAILIVLSAAPFYSGWLLWASCFFGWTLLTIAAIDYRCMILPDALTLPLIPMGLGISYLYGSSDLIGHASGAVVGFAAFSMISWLYRKTRGRDGLGPGDAKLLAASGAWVSTSGLPSVVFLSATSGLIAVLTATLMGRRFSYHDKVPFGPSLCFGTWLVWLIGPILLPNP